MKYIMVGFHALLFSMMVNAAPVSVNFAGFLDELSPSGTALSSQIVFNLSIVYDDTAAGFSNGPETRYVDAFSGSFAIDGIDASPITGDIVIGNDISNVSFFGSPQFPLADVISFNSLFDSSISIGGRSLAGFNITLADGDAIAVSSNDLLDNFIESSEFEVNHISMGAFDGALGGLTTFGYTGYVSNIATVPLPASAWFFISAVGGLVGFRKLKAT